MLYRLIKAGHVAYLVGGSVRDLMLGRKPKDFDVATSAHPQQVRDLFRNSRLIGRRFRLVHVFFGPKNIEVSTFRRLSEDGSADDPLIRHDNTFGTPEEDAFRRDFTVNALFYDPQTFRVIDYAGGAADLRARLIRTIGDAEVRVREDPVRMLRAVRFAAKLGFEIEAATLAAIERHRAELLKASVPRLVEETFRTIGQAGAARALILMEELGLLEQLMPWLSAHLKAEARPLREARTVRNLAALGEVISNGATLSHETLLAAMFLDLYAWGVPPPRKGEGFDLVGELRLRGFARADTEVMRLVLDAFAHLVKPSRRTLRLMNRPYFEKTRRLFETVAGNYGAETSALAAFMKDPRAYLEGHPAATEPRSRRRRGRRRRRHSQTPGQPPAAVATSPNGGPDEKRGLGGQSSDADGPPRRTDRSHEDRSKPE